MTRPAWPATPSRWPPRAGVERHRQRRDADRRHEQAHLHAAREPAGNVIETAKPDVPSYEMNYGARGNT
jgi:hypothetical protein